MGHRVVQRGSQRYQWHKLYAGVAPGDSSTLGGITGVIMNVNVARNETAIFIVLRFP